MSRDWLACHVEEQELEPMARELSAVLDHIAKIASSTSRACRRHRTSSRSRRLRADEPRPCLPREVALAQAPERSATAASWSQPAGMSELRSSS